MPWLGFTAPNKTSKGKSLLQYLIVVSYHTIHKDNKKALIRKKDGKVTSDLLFSTGKRKKSFRFFYTILGGDMGSCYSSCLPWV